jgi:hypothetical protein
MDDWVVGIDLGATKIALGLVRPESSGAAGERIAARDRFPTGPAAGPEAAMKFLPSFFAGGGVLKTTRR